MPQHVQLEGGLIFIPKFKEGIKVRVHRRLPENGKIKQDTFSRTPTGKYFVSILVETDEVPQQKTIDPDKTLGIDVGIKDFAIPSDGTKIEHPRTLSKYEKQ